MIPATDNTLLFAAVDVAKCIGLEAYHLRALEPEGFGSPGHWRMNHTGDVVYTERGMELLVETLTAGGRIKDAADLYALLATERQKVAVPSRALITPGPKSSAQPYYRTHPTLS